MSMDILTKEMVIGAGWDPSNTNKDVDIDLFAVAVIDQMEKVKTGFLKRELKPTGKKEIVTCYYGNKSPTELNRGLVLDEDNRTGEDRESLLTVNGRKDDEQIHLNLDKLPESCSRVYVGLDFYNAGSRTFKDVNNIYTRLHVDGEEMFVANIDNNPEKDNAKSIHYLTFRKEDGEWSVEFVGDFLNINGIKYVRNHMTAGKNYLK